MQRARLILPTTNRISHLDKTPLLIDNTTMNSRIENKTFILEFNELPLREFDMGGVLYHGRYFHIYENTRESFLQHSGIPYQNLVKENTHLAVVESKQKFIKPIFYTTTFTIYMHCSNLNKASFTFDYSIIAKDEIIHTAQTKHTAVTSDQKSIRIKKISDALLESLQIIYHE